MFCFVLFCSVQMSTLPFMRYWSHCFLAWALWGGWYIIRMCFLPELVLWGVYPPRLIDSCSKSEEVALAFKQKGFQKGINTIQKTEEILLSQRVIIHITRIHLSYIKSWEYVLKTLHPVRSWTYSSLVDIQYIIYYITSRISHNSHLFIFIILLLNSSM